MSTITVDTMTPSAGGTEFTLEEVVAKALVNYDQTTPTVTTSTNVSGVTDNAAGDFAPAFSDIFASAAYEYVQGHRCPSTSVGYVCEVSTTTDRVAGGHRVRTHTTAFVDFPSTTLAYYGELA